MAISIFFTGDGHKDRWLSVMQEIGKVYAGKLDPEYGAALYILTADLTTWMNARPFVGRDGIAFEALLKQVDFSGGYSVLIHLAGNLFNDRTACNPVEVATRLDDSNFQIALCALQLRRVSLPLSELEQEAKDAQAAQDTQDYMEHHYLGGE